MPPINLSDEEMEDDDVEVPDEIPATAPTAHDQDEDEDEEGGDEDEDEEGGDEDEYQVEKILDHMTVGNAIHYQIKWLGYEDEADNSWEPIGNLTGATELLKAYHSKIGGTPQPEVKSAKKSKAKAGKRTASEAFDSPKVAAGGKRKGRKSDTNGGIPDFVPPTGSWDGDIIRVAAIVGSEDYETTGKHSTDPTSLQGLLEWESGNKTQHKMSLLRTKCPQRLLDYYEQHLVFKGDPRFRDQGL